MDSEDYRKKTAKVLRDECVYRGLKIFSGGAYVSKAELVNKLEEDDREKALKKTVKIPPWFGKTILVLGVGPPKEPKTKYGISSLPQDYAYISPACVPWENILANKITSGTFSKIFIVEGDCFFTKEGGTVDKPIADSVLKTLKPLGEVWLERKDTPREYTAKDINLTVLSTYLMKAGYCSRLGGFQTYWIDKRIITFTSYQERGIFSLSKIIPANLAPSSVPPLVPPKEEEDSEGDLEPLEEFEEYEEVPTGITDTNWFKTKSLDITLDDFREEIASDEFISSFLSSAQKFLAYKRQFYEGKLKETKKEFTRIKPKVDSLQRMGTKESAIQDMYPMYSFYAGFIIQLQDIISLVAKKINSLTVQSLRKGLTRALDNTKKGFASLVGREDIKVKLVSLLYSFSKTHKTLVGAFNNICLMGKAGVGKTAIANVIGYVYSKSGILATNIVKVVSRADLVKGWIGQTAPATRSMLFETLEGVLFIDEAYQLTPLRPGRDFGPEAMTEIVNFLGLYKGMSIVMVAGYENKMVEEFFPSNQGLSRRFPHILKLTDYSYKELADILIRNINNQKEERLDKSTANLLYSIVSDLGETYPDVFSNQAGDMLNLGSAITKAIHSSYKRKWIEGDDKNNKPIVMRGVKEFMDNKGINYR